MISSMSMAVLAEQLGAQLLGDDVMFSNLSIDTRTIQPGEAYLALQGERFDGHDFAKAAADAKASALILEKSLPTGLPHLVVADTHIALGEIARINRQKSQARVIAVTGSQGKTTVKEMINSILSNRSSTVATSANLNNTIGVPLTLLNIGAEHRFAVIEMGANRAGEIAFSANITEPDIALITNASPAHVEGFGSLEGIVEAKGEILDSLSKTGRAILNADDNNVQSWITRASHCRQVLFSGAENPNADYVAHNISTRPSQGVRFKLQTPQGDVDISLRLPGEHNALNATAAAAAALEAGATLQDVRSGLAEVSPVPGRLVQMPGRRGALLLDDTYNASPSSFVAAINVLASFSEYKILIAGDMKELAADTEAAHAAVGHHARVCNIDEVWATGEFADVIAHGYGAGAQVFATQQELIEHSQRHAGPGQVYLVKGSRGARMENIVNSLKREGAE